MLLISFCQELRMRVRIFLFSFLNYWRLLGLFLGSIGAEGFADTIRLVGDPWCPIACEAGSNLPGYFVEIATKVFEKAGHKVQYTTTSWSRSLNLVRHGKSEGAVGGAVIDAPDLLAPQNELGKPIAKVWALKDSKYLYEGVEKLKKDKPQLGIIKDYSYEETFDAYTKERSENINVAYGEEALETNINLLLKKRLEIIVEFSPIFEHTVKSLGLSLDQFKSLGNVSPSGAGLDSYILFTPEKVNPKSKVYAQILSDGVEELRKSGELEKILKKYGLQDWK